MKEAKCPNCGAKFEVDDLTGNVECAYCGSLFLNENKPKKEEPKNEVVVNKQPEVPPQTRYVQVPRRPRINWFIAIVLFCISFFLGFVYIVIKSIQKSNWDKKYGG